MTDHPALADLRFLVGAWRIGRHTAGFSQRFEAQVDTGHGVINGHWCRRDVRAAMSLTGAGRPFISDVTSHREERR